jgi:hypothetical protein
MDDHDHEEDEVEPGEWTPAERKKKSVIRMPTHKSTRMERSQKTHLNPVTAPQAKLNHISGT